jgi:PleD family two-component response regulator
MTAFNSTQGAPNCRSWADPTERGQQAVQLLDRGGGHQFAEGAGRMLMTNDRNRVLIVDDDESCREVLIALLRDHGFHASAARNGREMDAALQAGDIDLLLLDVGLPGEDGLAM